jgi:hypothetical protein
MKRKMTKKGIDAIKHEFFELTNAMKQTIKGGLGSDCVFQAISIVAQKMGVCLDSDSVHDTAVDIVMADNPTLNRASAEVLLYRDGLTNTQTNVLLGNVFSGCECGGSCYDSNSDGAVIISFAQRDQNGNIKKEDGKEITHAAMVLDINSQTQKMLVRDKNGDTWINMADLRFCYFVSEICDTYQIEGCGGSGGSGGSGGGGNSSSSSDSGSGY